MDRDRDSAESNRIRRTASGIPRDYHRVVPASTGPATLGGLDGEGILSVVFDAEGEAVASQGTWFPRGSEVDLTHLDDAMRDGRTVRYEGPAEKAETAGHDESSTREVSREVMVTGIRTYEEEGGGLRVLVSFVPEEEMDEEKDDRGDDLHPKAHKWYEPFNEPQTEYTMRDFMTMDLESIVRIVGIDHPGQFSSDGEEQRFRRNAWLDYETDIENRDEWGTARQGDYTPYGEGRSDWTGSIRGRGPRRRDREVHKVRLHELAHLSSDEIADMIATGDIELVVRKQDVADVSAGGWSGRIARLFEEVSDSLDRAPENENRTIIVNIVANRGEE